MFCPHCGKKNSREAHFCTQCGNRLVDPSLQKPLIDGVLGGIDSAPMSPIRSGLTVPPGVAGWSWGAFIFGWFWAVCNKTWIGLFALIPGLGFIMHLVLGFKGREWAWQNDDWDSVEHFLRVQQRWSRVALSIIFVLVLFVFGLSQWVGSYLEIPMPTQHMLHI